MSDEAIPEPHPEPVPFSKGEQWEGAQRSREVIMFTDIEGSVNLQQSLGTGRYAVLLKRHDTLFAEAMTEAPAGRIIKHTGDGYLSVFDTAREAVTVALRFQSLLHDERWADVKEVRVRIGIHAGEVLIMPSSSEVPGTVGAAVNLAARVMGLAYGGQILITHSVFDEARQVVQAMPGDEVTERNSLSWVAHGAYLAKGIPDPVDVYEVGVRGVASFRRPSGDKDSQRAVSAEEEATLGWRPGARLEVPRRPGWMLAKCIGEGGFGEVWLGQNRQTSEQRVFKFCFDVVRLRSFKRELALFRMIREQLGARDDIATLYEVHLESPPFFLESEYCSGGTLREWVEKNAPSSALRLAMMAQIARALAAAHSVGIIHKDVKPSNIFVHLREDGVPHPRLADFGIGVLAEGTEHPEFDHTFSAHLSSAGNTQRTGTRMYSAPEYMIGKPATIQGDIFSLGVLLYQMVINDFDRPMGTGWRRDVADPMLRDDIAQCVDIDAGRRFSSALVLAERLEAIEARHADMRAAEEQQQREARLAAEQEEHRKFKRKAIAFTTIVTSLLLFAVAMAWVLDAKRKDAVAHAQALDAARRHAELMTDAAEEGLYVANMSAATEDMLRNRETAIRTMLDKQRPVSGGPDRRGWEWYYADTVLNPGLAMSPASDRPLRAMAVSPDEREVAVAGDDGKISIWSADTLEKRAEWDAQGGTVRSLSWNSQGLLAVALDDGCVTVWEAAKQLKRGHWKAHEREVTSVLWHLRDPLLFTGSTDGVIRQWDADGVDKGQSICKGPVLSMSLRNDSTVLAAILDNPKRIVVGEPAVIGDQHEVVLSSNGSALAWQPFGGDIAVSMRGVPMRVWNPYSSRETIVLQNGQTPGVSAFAWSPQGTTVAVGNVDGKILLCDPWDTSIQPSALNGHRRRVEALQWLKTRDRLLSVGEDGTLRAWDQSRRLPDLFTVYQSDVITASRCSPVQDRIAVMLAGDEVQLLDGSSWQALWSFALPRPVSLNAPVRDGSLAWSPDGELLAAACPGRALSLIRAADGSRTGSVGAVIAEQVSWMPDGKRLLVKDASGWLTLTKDGAATRLSPPTGTTWLVPFNDGRFGALTSGNGQVQLTTVGGSAPPLIVTLPKMPGQIVSVAVNASFTAVAIGSESGGVAWFDLRTGAWSHPGMTHSGPVVAITWSADAKRVASVGNDGTCRLFNVAQVAQNWELNYRSNPDINSVGWNARGDKLVLSCFPEGVLQVFDAGRSMDRESGHAPPPQPPNKELVNRCDAIAHHPNDGSAWRAFASVMKHSPDEENAAGLELVLAAADLGAKAMFERPDKWHGSQHQIMEAWQGQPLPEPVLVLQSCVLGDWDAVLTRCRKAAAPTPWMRLAHAEALLHLGRKSEAEERWLQAWEAQRDEDTGGAPMPASDPYTGSHPSLAAWANIAPSEDWTSGENNNLAELPPVVPQPDGFGFVTGPFIQLAGRCLRAARDQMLPRSTDWMPLGKPAQRVAFMLAASCYAPPNIPKEETPIGTCVGSLHLRRANGGAVRIPLIYGRNVWDWWVPSSERIPEAPPQSIAWKGSNPKAAFHKHSLALYRLTWEAAAGESPVTDFSISSTLRRPAPMLLSAEVLP